jgi:hypothetical protein
VAIDQLSSRWNTYRLAIAVDDLALVLPALGNGLAIESLGSPNAVRHDLYGDFVKLPVSILRERGLAQPSRRHIRAKQ